MKALAVRRLDVRVYRMRMFVFNRVLVSLSRERPVQQRFDLAFEHDSRRGVVHFGPEHDAPLRVDQRV
jgi:hypothetical protein